MGISESTAMARARAARAKFPKGTITTAQARSMFVAMVDSQVGYVSGNPNWSIYGKASNWRSKWNGRQVYWCAMFGSWAAEQAFGREAALAGFGRQYHSASYPPVGGTWTVWVLSWARSRGAVVSFNNQQSGDICLTDWNRVPGAEVDHYDIVRGPRSGNLANVIGGNTSPGNASAGAGVYRAARPRSRVRAIVRPDWNALVATYNANIASEEVIDFTRVAVSLKELGYPANEAGVRAYQSDKDDWGHNLTVDGVPGPATEKALGESMSKIDQILKQTEANGTKISRTYNDLTKLRGERTNAHVKQMALLGKISDQLNVVGRVAAEARELARSVPQRVVAARVPFIKGTSMHRLFGDDFRFGALLGYAGASFVDRDTHTEEIVDALDADALESEAHSNEDDQERVQLSEDAHEILLADEAENQTDLDLAVDVEEKS